MIELDCSPLPLSVHQAGQALAAKGDLLPKAYAKELSGLLDDCYSETKRAVRLQVELELGAKVEDEFAHFDFSPLSSATIAQVHVARVRNGELPVAVKVQHRGVRRLMHQDLNTLLSFFERVRLFPFLAFSSLGNSKRIMQRHTCAA